MHHLACAVEVCATGGVLAHARALDALFVLLVAVFAGFLVLFNQFNELQRELVEVIRVERVGQVLIELLVLHWAFVASVDNDRAVGQFFKR